jgi:hypothetical protein
MKRAFLILIVAIILIAFLLGSATDHMWDFPGGWKP